MHWQSDVDLGSQNTLALPCIARSLVCVSQIEELSIAISEAIQKYPDASPLILGGGSNLILPPQLEVPVIKLDFHEIEWKELDNTAYVTAGASVIWDNLVEDAVLKGWQGLENLSLIPGTVGASPIQNIGAYGVELGDSFVSLKAFDGANNCIVELNNEQCRFAYRDSIFKQDPGRFLILQVTLELNKSSEFVLDYGELRSLKEQNDEPLSVQMVRDKVIEVRQAKLPDPSLLPNAGSFFKNPVVTRQRFLEILEKWPNMVAYEQASGAYKLAAGWMIDQLGWKGKRRGPVGMHDKQALVMVNYGKADQWDVLALAQEVTKDVKEQFLVDLEIEPVIVTEHALYRAS